MSDPWSTAAHTIRERNKAKAAAAAQAAAAERQQQVLSERRYNEWLAAVGEATEALERFMQKRGAAGQELMAAFGGKAYITFGGETGGGEACYVFFDGGGIRKSHGEKVGYGYHYEAPQPATAREAVEAFACRGEDYKQPAEVRGIVQWLTERLDRYAAHA